MRFMQGPVSAYQRCRSDLSALTVKEGKGANIDETHV